MNVLFIFTVQDSTSPSRPVLNMNFIQFGISYISSFLKSHGHNTRLLVLTRETNRNTIDKCIDEFRPGLICFTAIYSEYEFIADIAKHIKRRYPRIFLLAGGVHVSLNPETSLPDAFDALCIGEGEHPALELIEQLQDGRVPSGIQNLWIKRGGSVEKNPTRLFMNDLNALPTPDRKMWKEWLAEPDAGYTVLLGRGCPFKCTYCSNHALKKLSQGQYVRFRSPDNILDEIKDIATDDPGAKNIYLEVETIAINKKFITELCSKLEQLNATLSKSLSFGVNIRVVPNVNLDGVFHSLKKANFQYVNIGLESGSERVRREILRRNYSNEDIVRTVSSARRHGLKVCFYNLIGIPGETMEDFKETVDVNRRCLPDWHYLTIFYPYPGTDLYNMAKDMGLITKPLPPEAEMYKAYLDLPGFSRKRIQKNYIWFDYYVYKGKRPLHKILAKILMSKIRTNYRLLHIYRSLTNNAILRPIHKALKRY